MRAIYASNSAVIERLHTYFAEHGDGAAPPPGLEEVERMVNAAFWASLRRVEGYPVRISLAFVAPERAGRPMRFERPLRFSPPELAKVAPAVERPGIHLGVWPDARGTLRVWGATEEVPPFCFVLEVVSPGLIVAKHRRGERYSKFVNVAVLSGDEAKIVDDRTGRDPDCPHLLTTLLGLDAPSSWVDPVNVLVQLAVSMRAHGRGGALLVVPAGSDAWSESIVGPVAYRVDPPFGELRDLSGRAHAMGKQRKWRAALARAVDATAGLTAVDGATIVTDAYELLAFGVKILRREGFEQVERVLVSEPVEGNETVEVHPSALGGTRHLSAAQFASDQRDALALVASQDGRFTVFAWSPCENAVHAHRIETLLL